MNELEDWYRESLVSRIDALQSARKSLGQGSQEALESIRRIAHSLRGSGGTFGFPEITEAAARVEEANDDEIPPALDTLIDLLKRTANIPKDQPTSTVLVIDDDPDILHFLKAKLADPARQIETADTLASAQAKLKESPPSLIILDLVLPDGDGRSFLLRLREDPHTAGIPVLVLSAKQHPTTKAECYALGANGFFEKPFDAETLSAAVASNIQRAGQTTKAARQDWLTKLPNRAAFTETFQRLHSYAKRQQEPLTAAILDLDNFKSVNDLYGHALGDEVLRRTAKVVSQALRKSDYLARWGGEEFVVLMPNTDPQGGVNALEKALQALQEETFQGPKGETFTISFSAGVTSVNEDSTVEEAIAEADRYLYIAKSAGKNQVCTAENQPEMPAPKILFAEDDEIVASIVKHRLQRQGFKVIHYTNGKEAFKKAQSTPANLAILDVKMPGMDGFDLLAHLRQLPTYASIPIVMLTGMGKEQDTVRALELGADDYILKPFSPVELLARIRRLLRSYEATHR